MSLPIEIRHKTGLKHALWKADDSVAISGKITITIKLNDYDGSAYLPSRRQAEDRSIGTSATLKPYIDVLTLQPEGMVYLRSVSVRLQAERKIESGGIMSYSLIEYYRWILECSRFLVSQCQKIQCRRQIRFISTELQPHSSQFSTNLIFC